MKGSKGGRKERRKERKKEKYCSGISDDHGVSYYIVKSARMFFIFFLLLLLFESSRKSRRREEKNGWRELFLFICRIFCQTTGHVACGWDVIGMGGRWQAPVAHM